jgi:hypothetical protein
MTTRIQVFFWAVALATIAVTVYDALARLHA